MGVNRLQYRIVVRNVNEMEKVKAKDLKELIVNIRMESCEGCPYKGTYQSLGIRSFFRKVPACKHCGVMKQIQKLQNAIQYQRDNMGYKY